ncbi:MAG: hypothetical protein K2Z81_28675, partial [Cyanobacteria bacterium]|nr:hypothetical protein [Cyanobacteriota bacterium]
ENSHPVQNELQPEPISLPQLVRPVLPTPDENSNIPRSNPNELLPQIAPSDGPSAQEPMLDKVNNLAKMTADAIIKDQNIHALSKCIAMGGDPKLIDQVNKELEKAGSKLRVRADWTAALVCGADPRTQGAYSRLDLRLIGADGKTIQSATPIDEMKNGRNHPLTGYRH